jgi:glyoxylase-like metal-dependent hydrolase (beta-lactamase superfamily II)
MVRRDGDPAGRGGCVRISRLDWGDFEIAGIADARPAPVDPCRSYPGTTTADWEPHRRWLTADGGFQPDLGCFLLRGPMGVVLVDAGIGPGPVPYLGDVGGCLMTALASLGVTPADVDAVLFTHLHFDHVGWACVPDAQGRPCPAFPRARYVVGASEWAFWSGGAKGVLAHHREAYARAIQPLADAGALAVVADGSSPVAGLTYAPMPGNTPGHQGLRVESGGARALFAADLCHCPAQVAAPLWSHRSDVDPEAGRRSRLDVFAACAQDDTLLAFGHFPRGADLGHVRRAQTGWRWEPLGAAA